MGNKILARSLNRMAQEITAQRHFILYAFLIGIGIRLLMGLQGFDTVDMGFCMTFYQNIFWHPESMPFYFNYYLTGFIGGLWQWAFADWGLLGFRLLDVLARAATILILYRTFRAYIPSERIAAFTILLAFLFPTYIITFHYNTVSVLLLSVSLYLFTKAYQHKCVKWMFAAGIALGITLFARSVNLALTPLLLLPLIHFNEMALKTRISFTTAHIIGFAIGILSILCLLWGTGQITYFYDGLNEAFCFFFTDKSDFTSTHTSGNIVWSYLISWKNVVAQLIALLLICAAYVYSSHLQPNIGRLLKVLSIISLFVLAYTSLAYITLLTVCLLIVGIAMRNHNVPRDIIPAVAYAIIGTLLLPIGSDMGMTRIFNHIAQLLIFPTAICAVQIKSATVHKLLPYCYASIAFSAVGYFIFFPYEEEKPRWSLTTKTIDKTLNVYTDSDKAACYNNIIDKILTYGHDVPTLLMGSQNSELYYATGKLPFTTSTQATTYNGEILPKQLAKQELFYKHLPIVVFLKKNQSKNEIQAQKELRPWLAKKRYVCVYEDSDLIIYKSNYKTSL